jgi:hypothetical protein
MSIFFYFFLFFSIFFYFSLSHLHLSSLGSYRAWTLSTCLAGLILQFSVYTLLFLFFLLHFFPSFAISFSILFLLWHLSPFSLLGHISRV